MTTPTPPPYDHPHPPPLVPFDKFEMPARPSHFIINQSIIMSFLFFIYRDREKKTNKGNGQTYGIEDREWLKLATWEQIGAS